MTRENKLRALGGYTPDKEAMLDIAVDEGTQFVWDVADWSWKVTVGTFSSSGSTYELPTGVDNILELTYGTNNRVVVPLPSYRIAEKYHNTARTGSITYYYSLYSADSDAITLELTPAPAAGTSFTYRSLRKIDYGDLSAVPGKLHSLVFTAARMFMSSGAIEKWPSLEMAIQRDKPLRYKRWTMGQDEMHVIRVNEYNSIMYGGFNQDTDRPVD
jgi:hypothetical protein